MNRTSCHARSLDTLDHPSRHWVKALHAQIKLDIPEGWRLFGENLYAKHSIYYGALPTYFFLFMIVDSNGMVLSWDEMTEYATLLGLQLPPVLFRGVYDEKQIAGCYRGRCPVGWGEAQEGYVVRYAGSFPFGDFEHNVAKWVRAGHVQTDDFWMKNWVPNKLARRKS
jgi:hypothetical protein